MKLLKRILGWIILAICAGLFFGLLFYSVGLRGALAVLAISVGVTALINLGLHWVFDE